MTVTAVTAYQPDLLKPINLIGMMTQAVAVTKRLWGGKQVNLGLEHGRAHSGWAPEN